MNDPRSVDLYMNLAQTLRRLRQQRKATLRTLATAAGVTASLLSQIETGRVKPSVDTLFALAGALAVPVGEFFNSGQTPEDPLKRPQVTHLVVRREARQRLLLETGVEWELLTGIPFPGARIVEIHYPPGALSAPHGFRHSGRDFLLVTEGELTVRLEFEEQVLRSEDAMWFDAYIPHQLSNPTKNDTRIIAMTLDPAHVNQATPVDEDGHYWTGHPPG